jgi:hypothetical protein
MRFNNDIAQDLNKLSAWVRDKARYMNNVDCNPAKRNYEQQQTVSQALEETAVKIESMAAKYLIYYSLFEDDAIMQHATRQCKAAIRNELKYAKVRRST